MSEIERVWHKKFKELCIAESYDFECVDGYYLNGNTRQLWAGFRAAMRSISVDLPDKWVIPNEDGGVSAMYHAHELARSLEAAGIELNKNI